jgi:hypothetical protein
MKQIVVKIVIPETEYRGWGIKTGQCIEEIRQDFVGACTRASIKNYELEVTEEEV